MADAPLMETLQHWVGNISSLVWGPWMLALILGTGLFLMIRLKALPLLRLGLGFKQLWQGRKGSGGGDISPFNALMTSLSATIGTGNIVGVATAIAVGGPGALFWMWCSALLGMATKFAEAVCAVKFREKDSQGRYVGGPMYYIKNGLGSGWMWLAVLFAVFGSFAGFGIGNMVQANSVADALQGSFSIPRWCTGLALMLLAGVVLIGGVKRIAAVAGKLVPLMALTYLTAGVVVLLINVAEIPAALALIVESAFSPIAAVGGFEGALVAKAIQMGVARGVFSNEAGLGSAPIAHAASETDHPVRQGLVAMLGTFIDTIVICTITGLAIVVTGVWSGVYEGARGVALSQAAFGGSLPYGEVIVSLCLAVFAFTTILGWSYYGERCAQFLLGEKVIVPFRVCWVLALYLGATASLGLVWDIADVLNGLMAVPNLIALLLLSGVVVRLSQEFMTQHRDSDKV